MNLSIRFADIFPNLPKSCTKPDATSEVPSSGIFESDKIQIKMDIIIEYKFLPQARYQSNDDSKNNM